MTEKVEVPTEVFEAIVDRLEADTTLNMTGQKWRDRHDDPALAELRDRFIIPVIEEWELYRMGAASRNQPSLLPSILHGHWQTPEGLEKVTEYVDADRSTLTKGDVCDLALANAVFLAGRQDLDLVVWQTAAKERIRWLSVQLALARRRAPAAALAELQQEWDQLRDAALQLLDRMRSSYRARNGKEMGIEADDGEKCWIVHSDEINTLEAAVNGVPSTAIDGLRRAVAGIADDFMTSETHHPGYVLIPAAKFDELRAFASEFRGRED